MWLSTYKLRYSIRQNLVLVSTPRGCIEVQHPCVKLSLYPWDRKPVKNQPVQRIDLVIYDVGQFYTYFSKGSLGSYNSLLNP